MIFGQPLMLWGLLALAVPVVVHLFNFRRYRKVYFSNVDRLEELRSESRRQSTLRRWLVLLSRLVAVAALVLAFARPSLPGKGLLLHSGATVVSVYVDNSFSMETSATAGSLLDQARAKAREVAAAYGPADRFQLLTTDLLGEQFRWLGRDEFLEAVDALQPSPSSRRLSEVVARQRDFMNQSGAANRHAYVVSDFQRSVSDLDQLPADSLCLFTLVPLEGVASDNLYIDTLRLDAPAYFAGATVAVEVSVTNTSTADGEQIPLKLFAGGRERAMVTLDIPAGASAKTLLRFTADSIGWLDCYAELTDYPVTFDDRYFFSLRVGEPVAMLEVPASQPNVSLKKLFDGDSLVRYASGELPPDLADLHFIVLNAPASLPSGQAQRLAAWVEEGGTLAVVPPANSRVDDLNALLSMLQAPRLDGWQQGTAKVASVDFRNGLYRNVFQATSDEVEMPSVQGRYRMVAGQAVGQALMAFADGGAMLSATPCGQGRVYLFASPLEAEWTDFMSQALFVPTLYNMALYSRPQPQAAHTLGSTAPIALQQRYDPAGTLPQLSGEGVALLPDVRRVGNRSVMVPHGELTAAGHYRLDGEHLAFNYSRLESDLSFLARSEVEALVGNRQGYSVVRNAAKPIDEELKARSAGTPLWRWCLVLALVALAVETALIKIPWKSSR